MAQNIRTPGRRTEEALPEPLVEEGELTGPATVSTEKELKLSVRGPLGKNTSALALALRTSASARCLMQIDEHERPIRSAGVKIPKKKRNRVLRNRCASGVGIYHSNNSEPRKLQARSARMGVEIPNKSQL